MSNVRISKIGQKLLEDRDLAFKVLIALHDNSNPLSKGGAVQFIDHSGKVYTVQVATTEQNNTENNSCDQ